MDAVQDKGISNEVRQWIQEQKIRARIMLSYFAPTIRPENVVLRNQSHYGIELNKTGKIYQCAQSNVTIVRPASREAEMIQRQQFLYDQTQKQREFHWPYCSLSEMMRSTMVTDAKSLPQ